MARNTRNRREEARATGAARRVADADADAAFDDALPGPHDTLLQGHLRRCLAHLDLADGQEARIVADCALDLGGTSVHLRMLPAHVGAGDTCVALLVDLGEEHPSDDTIDAAMQWNTCSVLLHQCAIGSTESGSLVLLQSLDIACMDDMALASALLRISRLGREAMDALQACRETRQ